MFYCEISSIGGNKFIKFCEEDQFCFGFLGCGFSAPGGLTLTAVVGGLNNFCFRL